MARRILVCPIETPDFLPGRHIPEAEVTAVVRHQSGIIVPSGEMATELQARTRVKTCTCCPVWTSQRRAVLIITAGQEIFAIQREGDSA